MNIKKQKEEEEGDEIIHHQVTNQSQQNQYQLSNNWKNRQNIHIFNNNQTMNNFFPVPPCYNMYNMFQTRSSSFSQPSFSKQFIQINSNLISQVSSTIIENAQMIQELAIKTYRQSELLQKIEKITPHRPQPLKSINQPQLSKKTSIEPHSPTMQVTSGKYLIHYLYGLNRKFKYKLIKDQNRPIEAQLFREKNFNFGISLVDNQQNVVQNINNICLQVSLFTIEQTPKLIKQTPQGGQIMKGFISVDLVQGFCYFQKLQIKAVTSHFKNNALFILVSPKQHTTSHPCNFNQQSINWQQIKPLVFQNVTVKAKISKKKQKPSQKHPYTIQTNN